MGMKNEITLFLDKYLEKNIVRVLKNIRIDNKSYLQVQKITKDKSTNLIKFFYN